MFNIEKKYVFHFDPTSPGVYVRTLVYITLSSIIS